MRQKKQKQITIVHGSLNLRAFIYIVQLHLICVRVPLIFYQTFFFSFYTFCCTNFFSPKFNYHLNVQVAFGVFFIFCRLKNAPLVLRQKNCRCTPLLVTKQEKRKNNDGGDGSDGELSPPSNFVGFLFIPPASAADQNVPKWKPHKNERFFGEKNHGFCARALNT